MTQSKSTGALPLASLDIRSSQASQIFDDGFDPSHYLKNYFGNIKRDFEFMLKNITLTMEIDQECKVSDMI